MDGQMISPMWSPLYYVEGFPGCVEGLGDLCEHVYCYASYDASLGRL